MWNLPGMNERQTRLQKHTTIHFFPKSIQPASKNLNFFTRILIPFLKNIIKYFVLQTKRLERLSMRQRLGLVLKVKPF